jgi:N-acetylmuramate 1-kinase
LYEINRFVKSRLIIHDAPPTPFTPSHAHAPLQGHRLHAEAGRMTPIPIAWSGPARQQAFEGWLAATAGPHRLNAGSVRLASADASFRRYFRVDSLDAASSFIIMDAPPAQENCTPFVHVADLMQGAGLQAPRVLAWDEPLGFMLLSDLGAQTMMDAIGPPAAVDAIAQPTAADHALYLQAVDVLVQWQLASKPGVLPPYDDALLSRELALFPDWYVAKHRSIVLTTGQQATLDHAFQQIKASSLNSLGGAQVFVHRDFMPRNLMTPTLVASRTTLPPGKAGSAAPAGEIGDSHGTSLGVLDFQDAVYGPITYDIASLMRDAFLSWDEDLVLDVTVRYWQQARKAGLPVGDDFGEFYRAVEWMGLQRHLKILGIFARLTLRDGKPKYLADTPRFMRYARATCSRYRPLGPLMVLLDEIEGNETRVGYTF